MTIASISEAKAKLSALLDRVRTGETITITDRGVPVAQLKPVAPADVDWDLRLSQLEREGVVRRPEQNLDVDAFLAMPKGRSRESVLEALLEERRESPR
jgi:prevent-host-death family protein